MSDESMLPEIKSPNAISESPQDLAAEYRAEREKARIASLSRYHDYLADALKTSYPEIPDADDVATFVLDVLFRWPRIADGEECPCGCHPRLPTSDLHDFGFDCSCTWDDNKRKERHRNMQERLQAWWDSPEYQEMRKGLDAEEARLQEWLVDHPDVTVSRHGGCAPEQWEGEVDGHSFYFRERWGSWHIEVDIEPTGRYYQTWKGTDDEGEDIYGQEPITEGKTIAEGSDCQPGYGANPVERIEFIVRTIRDYFRRLDCPYCNSPKADSK